MLLRMRCVPGAMVYRWFCVRSTRQPRSAKLNSTVSPMKSSASASRVAPPRVERLVMVLVRLAQLEGDAGREQEEADQHREVQQVAHVDHSLLDRLEMREEGERGDRIGECLRCPVAEYVQHQRKARQQEQKA